MTKIKSFRKFAKWSFRIGITGLLISLMPIIIDIKSTRFSEKINSQERLEEVIKEEAEKLGISRLKINGGLEPEDKTDKDYRAVCYQNTNTGNYEIVLYTNKLGNTRDGVSHELYHIARGITDVSSDDSKINIFFEEAQAMIYAATGIKLGGLPLSNQEEGK